MLVYNRYTYASLSFKVIISSIYEVLVNTSSYSMFKYTYLMFKYMIFVPFNTNIITMLYFQYIYSVKILKSCSYFPGFGLNYIRYKTTKFLYFCSSSSFVWNFMDDFIYDFKAVIFINIINQTILLSESDLGINRIISSRSSRNSKNNTMKIL